MNVTLFGKMVFADIIKFRVSRWHHPGFRKAEGNLRHKGEGHVKMEADTGVMQLHVKE